MNSQDNRWHTRSTDYTKHYPGSQKERKEREETSQKIN